MDADGFRTAGDVLFGHEWQGPIARALGALHPEGPRPTVDERLVRRWASGSREIPVWVLPAIVRIAVERAAALREEADAILEFAATLDRTDHIPSKS